MFLLIAAGVVWLLGVALGTFLLSGYFTETHAPSYRHGIENGYAAAVDSVRRAATSLFDEEAR